MAHARKSHRSPAQTNDGAQFGIRDFRKDLAAIVQRARSGEHITITQNGTAIARLGPMGPGADGFALKDLAAAGLIEPPVQSHRRRPPDPLPIPADIRGADLLRSVRGESSR